MPYQHCSIFTLYMLIYIAIFAIIKPPHNEAALV